MRLRSRAMLTHERLRVSTWTPRPENPAVLHARILRVPTLERRPSGGARLASETATMTDPIQAVRALQLRIKEAAPAIERERRVPQDLVDELVRADLFHMLIPRDLGGIEIDPVTAADAVEELAF